MLNELVWWIASQWENMPTSYEYKCEIRPNGTKNKSSIYGAFRNTTKLKEVYIIRYADDFKLFCRKRSDAEKVFIAVKQWLYARLKLEVSEEKSKIINLKRHYSEFLGFEIKAVKKRKSYVVKSHMTAKAIQREKDKLIEQVKKIAHVHMGGSDKYENLVIVHENVHRLIHTTMPETIAMYLNLIQTDKKALAKLNALRVMAGNPKI